MIKTLRVDDSMPSWVLNAVPVAAGLIVVGGILIQIAYATNSSTIGGTGFGAAILGSLAIAVTVFALRVKKPDRGAVDKRLAAGASGVASMLVVAGLALGWSTSNSHPPLWGVAFILLGIAVALIALSDHLTIR